HKKCPDKYDHRDRVPLCFGQCAKHPAGSISKESSWNSILVSSAKVDRLLLKTMPEGGRVGIIICKRVEDNASQLCDPTSSTGAARSPAMPSPQENRDRPKA